MAATFDTMMCTARRSWRSKALLTAVCLVCQAVAGISASDHSSPLLTHFIYMFEHVNVWHFLCNMIVLWSVNGRMETWKAILIAVVASYIPTWYDKPTLGLSGFLFALFGIMWGRVGRFKDCMKKGLPVIALTIAMPGVNGLIHLYCYVIGYIVGKNQCFR